MELKGKTVVVTGGNGGLGQRICYAFADVGCNVAVVYARSKDQANEVAGKLEATGVKAQSFQCDVTSEQQVDGMVAQVLESFGSLDILINDVWGGDPLTEWGKTFWEVDVQQGFTTMERAIHTHIITSRHGVPLMLAGDGGLIVELTDGAFYGYRGQLFYDLCKMSVIRLAYAMSVELADHPITAVAVTPGFLRSEAVLDHFGVTEENWRDAIEKDPHFAHSETPMLIGRVIAALAADPDLHRRAGQVLTCWDLARHYDVKDTDGRQPHWDEYIDATVEEIIDRASPSPEDIFLLTMRKPQLDFDDARAAQRARSETFLKQHGGPGRLDPNALD